MVVYKKILPICILGCLFSLNVFAKPHSRIVVKGSAPAPAMQAEVSSPVALESPARPQEVQDLKVGAADESIASFQPSLGDAELPTERAFDADEGAIATSPYNQVPRDEPQRGIYRDPALGTAFKQESEMATRRGTEVAQKAYFDGAMTRRLEFSNGASLEYDSSTGLVVGSRVFGPNGAERAYYVDVSSRAPTVYQVETHRDKNGNEAQWYRNMDTGSGGLRVNGVEQYPPSPYARKGWTN